MNAKEWVDLIGHWMLSGPIVLVGGGSVPVFLYALWNDPNDGTAFEWAWMGLLVLVFGGGSAVVFGTVLFRETRAVFRSAWERRTRGCCRSCGYSRRGNVSGTCPECGRPVKPDSHTRRAAADDPD